MKRNLSETWIRKALRSGEISPGDEIYDEKQPGLVLRVRKSKNVWYKYSARGRVKTKLADWPEYETDDARKLCRGSKDRRAGRVPTLQSYYDDVYQPTYELTHKSERSLYSLSKLLEAFGDLPLNQITAEKVENWRLSRRKANIAPSTVNRQVAALRSLLRGVIPLYLESDPLDRLKPLRVDQENRVRYLSDDEQKSLMDALDAREVKLREARFTANKWRADRGYELMEDLSNYAFADHLRPMVLISLNTGLRQGELFNLQWGNVSGGFVTVRSTIAKSRRSRSVPLNKTAASAFENWRQQTERSGFVFKGREGKFDNVRKAWNGVVSDAKLIDFTWHDMRHDFASKLVMRGVPLNTVRELLGHADLKTTLRYAHLAPKHLKEAVELL